MSAPESDLLTRNQVTHVKEGASKSPRLVQDRRTIFCYVHFWKTDE